MERPREGDDGNSTGQLHVGSRSVSLLSLPHSQSTLATTTLTSHVGSGHHEPGFSVTEKPREGDDGSSTSAFLVWVPFFLSQLLAVRESTISHVVEENTPRVFRHGGAS
jgi:hypothetical protein